MNGFQSLIFLGAAGFAILWFRRQKSIEQSLPMLILLGGFLFHLAWEVKGRYGLFYFVLLLPAAAEGLDVYKRQTCLGGAIRDPLSGRTYVYQAMRVTGAADPTRPLSETLKGKLPQRKLVNGAASGYSSYGNQIGLATGYVKEIYHPDYAAKRMEIGAVMGLSLIHILCREETGVCR